MPKLNQNQIAGLARQAGLTGQAITIASAIAMAESGGDTNAINPGHAGDPEYSVGLWQVNIRAHPQYTKASMQDPVQNAQAMASISSMGTNWNPWGAYTNRSYTAFMGSTVVPLDYSTTSTDTTAVTRTNITTNPAVLSDLGSGFKYVLAYTIAIAIFVLIAKFRAGYTSIYYGLLIILLFLLVTQSKFIYESLLPILPQGQNQGG
jgi:hypothetical protein